MKDLLLTKFRRVYLTARSALLLIALNVPFPLHGLVHFEQGRRMIDGVQLLRDHQDENQFFYVPQSPRLSTKPDGSFEFLCLKYVDAQGGTNGGLFHALIEFTLPSEVLQSIERKLREEMPSARIAGPVPLMQTDQKGEEGTGSFRIVSAVLGDRGEGGFTRTLITSGKAPLSPGSKAVVAAILNQKGATLLWDSFTGNTSDVSVAISAYYEAAVEGYNAKVTAEVETVYQHFSRIYNYQKNYTKRELRRVVDNLQREGLLKIEVVDRSQSLGIDVKDMEGILGIITDKLTEVMFDHETGWARDPEREAAVEANQIKGRQERGWFSSVFGGAQDTKYFSDDQYVLKRREDVKRNSFVLNLSKSTSIKIPVDTAGNLGGLYNSFGDDPRYFRVVNLDDPDFEFRRVHFQIDGNYADAFKDTINFVGVNVRKSYGSGAPAFTKSLQFTHDEVKRGITMQEIAFPRLGDKASEWTSFEYQVRWSVRDSDTISIPSGKDQWIKANDAIISLVPPFVKRVVEIDADRSFFSDAGVASGIVEFATVIGGKNRWQKSSVLRTGDSDTVASMAIYHDRDTPVGWRTSWFSPSGTRRGKLAVLDSDYLYIVP